MSHQFSYVGVRCLYLLFLFVFAVALITAEQAPGELPLLALSAPNRNLFWPWGHLSCCLPCWTLPPGKETCKEFTAVMRLAIYDRTRPVRGLIPSVYLLVAEQAQCELPLLAPLEIHTGMRISPTSPLRQRNNCSHENCVWELRCAQGDQLDPR